MQGFTVGTAKTGAYPAFCAHDFTLCAPAAIGINIAFF
jgi:hypothetical protein